MVQDVVKELGYLTLGTRFKRIGEALQAQTHALLSAHGLDEPSAHLPLLAALHRLGPLGVGELSAAVGVSQPVITRALHGLQARGLVQSQPSEQDRRVRTIALGDAGRALVQESERLAWPLVEAAVAEVCAPLQGPLLEQLAMLEAALQQTSLLQRAATAQPSTPPES